MEGSATFTTVVSRTIISMPTQRTTKTVQRWRSSRCCSGGFMGGSSCSGESGALSGLAARGVDGLHHVWFHGADVLLWGVGVIHRARRRGRHGSPELIAVRSGRLGHG